MAATEEIKRLLAEGKTYREIRNALGCAYATISYHAKKMRGSKPRNVYDWKAIQNYHDEGHSLIECRVHFGFSYNSWQRAIKRGDIEVRDRLIPLSILLDKDRRTGTGHLKSRLFKANIIQNVCSNCGLSEWLGKPLVCQLDHINGDGADNRIENLRMLCPNCHSQTETFCGKNKILRRKD